MGGAGEFDQIAARADMARSTLLWAGLAALLSLILGCLLIAPSSGINDVQLAGGAADILREKAVRLGLESPHLIGSNSGLIPLTLSAFLQLVSLIAGGALVWALVKRHRSAAKVSFGVLFALSLVGPIPTMLQPDPPTAIGVEAAVRLVGPLDASAASAPPWKRYMLAQIAYIRGSRNAARSLTADIDYETLGSPIEGRYRLQYLHGEPVRITNVCFKRGCLSPGALAGARQAVWTIGLVSLLVAVAAGRLLIILRARLARLDKLRVPARPAVST